VGYGGSEVAEAINRGNFQGCGINIVGRLMQINIFQRMNKVVIAFPAAGKFNGPVGDHFIEIHVGRGSRAALQGIYRELIRNQSFRYLHAGLLDQQRFILRQITGFGIGQTAGHFHQGQSSNE